MDVSIESLVKNCGKLVSFPDIAIRVNTMVNDPDVTAAKIGEVISQDPALTSSLLKVANSPLFGLRREIDTVSRAVTILGGKQVRDLALATSAVDAFESIPNELVSMDQFWYHSLCCALAAQELADRGNLKNVESVFIAGLLHDIGHLVIYNQVPELAVKSTMLSLIGVEGSGLCQAEHEVLGFDHAQLGGALVKSWGLPESLQACITFHHNPMLAENHNIEVALIHLANHIAYLIETDGAPAEKVPLIDDGAWQVAGLTEDVVDDVIASVQEKVAGMQSALKMSA